VVGRDQERDEEFGTALIAAFNTGLTHVVVLMMRELKRNFSPCAPVTCPLTFFSFCFRFTGAVNCSIQKFELMTFHIPFI
jgi:hypothetical protein